MAEAVAWYFEKSTAAADTFKTIVFDSIDIISHSPLSWWEAPSTCWLWPTTADCLAIGSSSQPAPDPRCVIRISCPKQHRQHPLFGRDLKSVDVAHKRYGPQHGPG
jgi:hypothetical protein